MRFSIFVAREAFKGLHLCNTMKKLYFRAARLCPVHIWTYLVTFPSPPQHCRLLSANTSAPEEKSRQTLIFTSLPRSGHGGGLVQQLDQPMLHRSLNYSYLNFHLDRSEEEAHQSRRCTLQPPGTIALRPFSSSCLSTRIDSTSHNSSVSCGPSR